MVNSPLIGISSWGGGIGGVPLDSHELNMSFRAQQEGCQTQPSSSPKVAPIGVVKTSRVMTKIAQKPPQR